MRALAGKRKKVEGEMSMHPKDSTSFLLRRDFSSHKM
jgi:hypothetical protein